MGGSSAPAPAAGCTQPRPTVVSDLPRDVVVHILALLAPSHEAVAEAAQTCKAWREAAADGAVWASLAAARRHSDPDVATRFTRLAARAAALDRGAAGMTAETSARPPSPRSAYAAASTVACYDCGVPCARSTLACAPLRLRLCHECVRGYSHAAPGQRLIAATSAKFAHRLNDADLASLPHALDANPIDPAFTAMRLYRRRDVRRAAAAKHGGWEAAVAATRPLVPRSRPEEGPRG